MINPVSLIETFVHLYCFFLFLRAMFPNPSEHFFNPLLRVTRSLTDPVLLFLKNNKVMANPLNPWIPIALLLFLKAAFTNSKKLHQ